MKRLRNLALILLISSATVPIAFAHTYYSYPVHNYYAPRVRYPTAQYVITPQFRYNNFSRTFPTFPTYQTYQPYQPPTYHSSAGGTCLHYLSTGECAIEQWNPTQRYRRYDDDDDDRVIHYNDDDDYYDYDDEDYDDDNYDYDDD